MLGRETLMPQDLRRGLLDPSEDCDPETYTTNLQQQMEETQRLAQQHLKCTVQRQNRDHDLRALFHQYQPGDVVYMQDTSCTKGCSPKLQPLWTRPALVLKKIGKVLYQVKGCKRTRTLHHDRLKPCHADQFPLWVQRFRALQLPEEPTTEADIVVPTQGPREGDPPVTGCWRSASGHRDALRPLMAL